MPLTLAARHWTQASFCFLGCSSTTGSSDVETASILWRTARRGSGERGEAGDGKSEAHGKECSFGEAARCKAVPGGVFSVHSPTRHSGHSPATSQFFPLIMVRDKGRGNNLGWQVLVTTRKLWGRQRMLEARRLALSCKTADNPSSC